MPAKANKPDLIAKIVSTPDAVALFDSLQAIAPAGGTATPVPLTAAAVPPVPAPRTAATPAVSLDQFSAATLKISCMRRL